jgi:hypothetical protein
MKSISNRSDTRPWALIAFCLLACNLAGCGGGSSANKRSANEKPASTDAHELAVPATVSISPDVVVKKETLSKSVVCRGDPTWLPISWKDLPSTTSEIVIAVYALSPPEIVSQRQRAYSTQDAYTIVGISPSVNHLKGSLPKGAYVLSKHGAPICPPPRPGQRFSFALYALPRGSTFDELLEGASSFGEFWTELSKRIVGIGQLSVRYPSEGSSGA